MRLRYAARSDVGLLREGNEDSVYAGPRLLAVADGVGGHAAGEVASAVTISTIAPLDDASPPADLVGALRSAVTDANEALREMVAGDRALEGMGTTLTALLWAGGRFGLVHIGDSRGYLLRDGELTQITHDHTFVQGLVDEGRISAEEANVHPQRNIVTRVLDGRDDVEPDVSVREVRPGDRYLLCSDGLSGVVSEATLRETLHAGSPDEAADRLVELALRGGAPDNVTLIVADVLDDDGGEEQPPVVVAGAAAAARQRPPAVADTPAARAAQAVPTERSADDADAPERPHGRVGRRVAVTAGAVVVVLAAGVGGAFAWISGQWYVGATDASPAEVAIYHGVEGDVAGLSLSRMHQRTAVPVGDLPDYEQQQVHDGISASGLGGARRIVARLRNDACAAARTAPVPAGPVISGLHSPSPSPAAQPRPSASGRPSGHSPSPSPSPSLSLPAYCGTAG